MLLWPCGAMRPNLHLLLVDSVVAEEVLWALPAPCLWALLAPCLWALLAPCLWALLGSFLALDAAFTVAPAFALGAASSPDSFSCSVSLREWSLLSGSCTFFSNSAWTRSAMYFF